MIPWIIGILIIACTVIWSEVKKDDDFSVLRALLIIAGLFLMDVGTSIQTTQKTAKDYDSGKIVKKYSVDNEGQVLDSVYVYRY